MVAQRVAFCLHQLPMMSLLHDGMFIKLFSWKVFFFNKNPPTFFSEDGEKFFYFQLKII